ncbi:MAG: T9SS type A sorting domain-containing protein, partial [Bacteroidia bacterium]|nr:T9SS type A sorting domain-containing protein [Bacteroidia bacterium]
TTSGGLTDIKQGANGCIYAMKGGYTTAGAIYRICPITLSLDESSILTNAIGQNYPNPADNITQIDYRLAQSADVSIIVYDVTGRTIKTVVAQSVQAGKHTVSLNDMSNYADGAYFYKFEVKTNGKLIHAETKRMIIAK